MKFREYRLKRTVRVYQVFRHSIVYTKTEKEHDVRMGLMKWPSFDSQSGFVKAGALFLPASVLEQPDLATCDVLTLEDHALQDIQAAQQGVLYTWQRKERPVNRCFNLQHPRRLDLFELRSGAVPEAAPDLHFRYDYSNLGVPTRENFRLGPLPETGAVEIALNGKKDTSYGRSFMEHHYIFEAVGVFDRFSVLREPAEVTVKDVPSDRKVVDLRKRLW